MRKTSVIVAEDDPVARNILDRGLTNAGFDVTLAADGEEAMGHIRQSSTQIVISDWEMPRMNGIDLCRAVRAADLGRYVYVLMLTSHDQTVDVIHGLEAGADDFVKKPFDMHEVVHRVRAGERLLALGGTELTIFLLARLAESRDPETGLHLERVRRYSEILCRSLLEHEDFPSQINAEDVRLIYRTSPLHDIGKVAVPDHVLLKPGKLTDVEFEIMKTHTTSGADTIGLAARTAPGAPYLQMAHDIARSHHERYDGSGYPDGLAGEDIPLAARIVALADVYDALTSKRIYKDAMRAEDAHDIIVQQAGTHFDPVVVEAYERERFTFSSTCRFYRDPEPPVRLAA